MTALEDIVQWEARLAIALDHLNEGQPKAVSSAASLLGHFLDRFAARPEVVETLLGPHRASIISRLLEVACSPNPYVQSAALGTLARLGCTDGYELAATAIDSLNPYVREAGIRLFGLAAPDNELVRLEPLIDDPHRPASVAAVRAIGRRRWRAALPRLLDLLTKRREEIRSQLETRPPRRGEIAPLLQTIVEFMGHEAVPLLVEIAEHDTSIRSVAVRELVYLDAPETAPVLAYLLTDPSRALREQVLRLLHRANYRAALPLVRPLLNNPESTIRQRALAIIADWSDAESATSLTRMAKEETNPLSRIKAIQTLVALVGIAAQNPLLDLAADTNPRIRKTVADEFAGLAEISEAALLTLQDVARNDADETVRDAAKTALRCHGSHVKRSDGLPMPSVAEPMVPMELLANLPALTDSLELWQKNLPEFARSRSVEEVCKVDEALNTILAALRHARLLVEDAEESGHSILTNEGCT